MTSLFRELVPVPKVGADSIIKTSLLCFSESSLAIAKPTTPAPITTQSTVSLGTDSSSCLLHEDDMVPIELGLGLHLLKMVLKSWSEIEDLDFNIIFCSKNFQGSSVFGGLGFIRRNTVLHETVIMHHLGNHR